MVKPRNPAPRRPTSRSGGEDDRGSATRRGLLSTVLTALFAGTAATQYLGTARAHAAVSDLTVSGDSVTTDSGQLTGLTTSVSGHVSYDGLDAEAASVDVELYASPAGGATDAARNRIASSSTAVADAAGLDTRAGHLDYGFTDADVLAADDLSSTDFAATGDGTTEETDVDFRLVLAVLDGEGNQLVGAEASTSATISVTNQSRQGGANGNGNTNAQGTNQSP